MNDAVLRQLRSIASDLSERGKFEIKIELKSGTVLKAKYDPLFHSVIIAGTTFPVSELKKWTKLFWGSEAVMIVKG
ncbi:MAG TPA: hypothetical protein VMT62_10500 [Syntrophorhabdaceae bacterium]|nr:hypothetical protein [Syntrophorhabdaceae bacterium]